MRRRAFIAGLGGVAALPRSAVAQSTKMLRLGAGFPLPRTVPFWVAFEQKLAALGYQEGRNLTIDYVQTSGFEGSDSAYRELVSRQPDILIAAGPELALSSARAATSTLPIVIIAVDYDPISRGHVTSLARPTSNITGVYFQSTELVGKRLQLMKEIVPEMTTATVFWDKAAADGWAAWQAAAPKFGVHLTGVELTKRPYDYERALVDVAPANRKVLIAAGSPYFFQDRTILAELGLKLRTPIMLNNRDSTLAGGLMSYAPSLSGMFALAADYVDRIAKGAKPADLPIQQPTKFELVINLKTAKALGLEVPSSILAQADEVIE